MAEMILLWLSFTDVSGKPTKKNFIPFVQFTSMVMGVALIPCTAAPNTLTSMTGLTIVFYKAFQSILHCNGRNISVTDDAGRGDKDIVRYKLYIICIHDVRCPASFLRNNGPWNRVIFNIAYRIDVGVDID